MKVLESKSLRLKTSKPTTIEAPRRIEYCDRIAGQLAELAHLTYNSPDDIARQSHDKGFPKYYFFNKGNTQAFLVGNDQEIILAFRGSEPTSVGDWISDAKCGRVKACGGRVHAGFWQDWQSIWEEVETQLQKFRVDLQLTGGHCNQRFLLTGHSLGGALAVLAGIQLQMCGYSVDGIYTFGTPRVGDRNFALQFNRRLYRQTFRLVNHKDVVPHLPPRELGYSHLGQLIYFDQTGRLCPYPGKDDDNFAMGESFVDHDMAAYKRCIQANPIAVGE